MAPEFMPSNKPLNYDKTMYPENSIIRLQNASNSLAKHQY
jgi:hypothetical protein